MSLELSGTTPAIKGVAGSVSAPALTGDDVDTGISFPSANTIKFSTGGVERMSITDSGVTGTGIGGGKILQVKQTFRTDTTSTSSSTYADVFTVVITPASASSQFLLIADLKIGYSSYSAAIMWKFVRTVSSSDTDLFIGDAAGNRARCTWGIEDTGSGNDAKFKVASTNGMFLDTTANTPNEITYRVKWKAQQNTGYLNRTGDDADGLAYPRTASSLTVMEYDPT